MHLTRDSTSQVRGGSVRRMMSKEDLVTLLRSWRVDGEIAFARALQSAMDTLPLKNRYLAIKFEVADLTVGRWASGLSKPHPRIQEYVVHALLALAEGHGGLLELRDGRRDRPARGRRPGRDGGCP